MRALLGTQPVFRQSPPMRCFSTRAARPPRPAVPAAVTRPAVPPPITTTLYVPSPLAGIGLSPQRCFERGVYSPVHVDGPPGPLHPLLLPDVRVQLHGV